MRWLFLLCLSVAPQTCVSAQTPDSVRTDSVVRYSFNYTNWVYFTRVVQLPGRVDTLWLPKPDTTVTPPPPVALGIPFGPFSIWASSTRPVVDPAPFTASTNYTGASGIVTQIAAARALKHKLQLAMTGGAHDTYITNGKFDLAKWKAVMNGFNTATTKAAVAAGVADGTIIGNSVMDEPEHESWGGVMTKAVVSSMVAYVKAIFPTLPVGVVHGPYPWRPTDRYTGVDYVQWQYNWSVNYAGVAQGDVVSWRASKLAQNALDGVETVFSMNLLNGGTRVAGCPIGPTGGAGTFSINCRMTAAQVREWGLTLGPAGCVLFMWKYDAAFMARSDNHAAFKSVADSLARVPAKSCRRP